MFLYAAASMAGLKNLINTFMLLFLILGKNSGGGGGSIQQTLHDDVQKVRNIKKICV